MAKPFVQIGDEIREMTDAEYAQRQKDIEEHAAQAAANAVQQEARKSAFFKFAALGLTEAEIAALIGA